MKRKEEVETMIAAIARKLRVDMSHVENGNTKDRKYLEHVVKQMQKLTEYIDELKGL